MNEQIMTVTQVSQRVKNLVEHDAGLAAVIVQGEISNYKTSQLRYSVGHFFSLKDENSVLKCVMFGDGLRFQPENGMEVVAIGRIEVYPQTGVYQLKVTAMMPVGVGEAQLALDQLQRKLAEEGLFDEAHKKPIPPYPNKIALITSPTGAAVRDMVTGLEARWPMARVCILPVRVQGAEAAGEISWAIAYANSHHVADLIVTGRGGGSKEDLWCFNDEDIARAIYNSRIPVITAIGHEEDNSIADLVADRRVMTPTDVAKYAVPDQNEVYAMLSHLEARLHRKAEDRLALAHERLTRYQQCRALTDPMNIVTLRREKAQRQQERLAHALVGRLGREKQRFAALAAKLDALSPLEVLGRGYAIPQKDNKVITSAKALDEGDRFTLRMCDGTVPCLVEKG